MCPIVADDLHSSLNILRPPQATMPKAIIAWGARPPGGGSYHRW